MTLFLGLVFPLRWPFTWCDIFPLPIIIIIVWYLPFIYNYLRVLSPLHPLITCDTPIAYAVHGVDYNILSVTAEQSMESSTSGYNTTNESGITAHLEGPHITKKLAYSLGDTSPFCTHPLQQLFASMSLITPKSRSCHTQADSAYMLSCCPIQSPPPLQAKKSCINPCACAIFSLYYIHVYISIRNLPV